MGKNDAALEALLPIGENASYRQTYGLYATKHEVARGLDEGRALLPTHATLWPRLKELFGIIAEGSSPLKVTTFDGGLFDPERHPFIEEHTVGDARLRASIDKLARVDGQFVDYRDLAERHLGTIYEGLLEFHPVTLPEPETLPGGIRFYSSTPLAKQRPVYVLPREGEAVHWAGSSEIYRRFIRDSLSSVTIKPSAGSATGV